MRQDYFMQLTKRQVQDELWKRGEISWKLHDGQLKILDMLRSTDSWIAMDMCGRQLGKTIFNLFLATSKCFQLPGTVVKYGSAHYEDLQNFIFPKAFEFFKDCPSELVDISESRKEIVFPMHKSKIDFFGCDRNPDGARGPTIPLVILDEAQNIQKLRYIYYDVIVPMFIHMQHLSPKCLMSGTPPDTPDHPFSTFFKDVAIKRNAFIKLTIDDNPLLNDSQRQRVIDEYFEGVQTEGHKKVQWQKMRRELYCDILVDQEKAIVPEFHHELVQPFQKDKYFQFRHKYVGMDLGTKHKTVALYGVYDFMNARLHITDEMQMFGPTMTTKVLAETLRKKEVEAFGTFKPYKRVSDNNNLLLLQDLNLQYNLHFTPVIKRSNDKLVRRPLMSMVNKIRVWTGEGRIHIDPKCKELIGCMESAIWDNNREHFAESEVYGHYDALAALMYMLQVIDEKTNPTPMLFEKDTENIYIFPKEKKYNKFFKMFR
jgi:hypothetical protein